MQLTKTILVMALLSAGLLVAQEVPQPAAVSDWEAWRETTILVGNERDGFNDVVKGRRCLTNPEAHGGYAYLPYLAKAPDEGRVLLLMTVGTPQRKGRLLESTDEGETWHEPVPKGNRAGGADAPTRGKLF